MGMKAAYEWECDGCHTISPCTTYMQPLGWVEFELRVTNGPARCPKSLVCSTCWVVLADSKEKGLTWFAHLCAAVGIKR